MVIDTDLEEILAKALEETRGPDGQVNLAEIQRRTGVSRKRLRRWKSNGFHLKPDKRGRKPGSVKLEGYTEIIDGLLAQGIRNRDVVLRELQKAGFDGGRTIVGDYIASHLDLLPAPRAIVAPQGEYTRRWYTESGDCYQMDWGFVEVEDTERRRWRCACFVMVCHHCGYRYIEFFPNSRQENLFIGMLHAFSVMGVPKRILTDNMKSVTLGRDEYRNIIWNAAYNEFQQAVGFKTDLCKVAHPFTKGKVEIREGQLHPGKDLLQLQRTQQPGLAVVPGKECLSFKGCRTHPLAGTSGRRDKVLLRDGHACSPSIPCTSQEAGL